MPAIGGTAFPVAGDVFTLVRTLVGDIAGNVWSDARLLPLVNSAYRKVNSALGNVQATSYIKDNYQLIVPAVTGVDPSEQVVIDDATAPPNNLPPDLLVPLKLWERISGSSDNFVEMTDLTDGGGLPSRPQGESLLFWEWRQDGLYFIGAQQDTQIRMRYEAAFLDVTDATSPILIRNGTNAIAFQTALLAGTSRGAAEIASWKQGFDEAIESIKNRAAMREQNRVRRRRPYSSRNWITPYL